MKTLLALIVSLLLTYVSGCSQNASGNDRAVGGGCEDCNLIFAGMPAAPSWKTTLSGKEDAGDLMTISGTIFQKDGKSPAPNVILYVYHTDAKGNYSPSKNQAHAKRHGHLRGWMKTDAQGKYQFSSIRPASYPNSKAPQHIHPIIKEPGVQEYWIDEYLFEDDPNLTAEERNKQEKRGGSGVIKLTKNDEGTWEGKRDIVLGRNIPGY
jgi:protocatechuate 3,4-dioxygenase, beta subunit